jgi:IS5 family transposase
MKNLALLTGLAALTIAGAAQAQILKCVGKDGKIEFATSCPSGTKQQETGVVNKPVPAAARADGKSDAKDAPKTTADREAEFRKRQADQQAAATKAAQAATENEERLRACQSAQSNLTAIKSRQRMSRTNAQTGERIFYDEADYQREQPIAERQVAEYCKS